MKSIAMGVVILLASAAAAAQNNTNPASAVNLAWGQKVLTTIGVSTATTRWYRVFAVAGRSYCAETAQAETTVSADRPEDSVLTLFDHNGTPFASNDDAGEEPYNSTLSRLCWIPSIAQEGVTWINIAAVQGTPAVEYVTLRLIETTLYCPWFFVAGDYNAFSLIRNAAVTALNVTVTWRGLNGTVAGKTTVLVPPDGTVVLNARNFVNPGLFSNGSVEIAHAGSPDQIMGSTTTLSGTTGLGFDAQFTQRKTW